MCKKCSSRNYFPLGPLWSLNAVCHWKDPGSLEKWLLSGLGQERYREPGLLWHTSHQEGSWDEGTEAAGLWAQVTFSTGRRSLGATEKAGFRVLSPCQWNLQGNRLIARRKRWCLWNALSGSPQLKHGLWQIIPESRRHESLENVPGKFPEFLEYKMECSII